MSLPIFQTCKRRNKSPKLYGFSTFCNPGSPIQPTGAFRDNIRVFLQECAEFEDYSIDSLPVWCTLLVQENRGLIIPLYTIEETPKFSPEPFCDHCRSAGWSHHYMSKRKYHVIVPLDSEWAKPLDSNVFDSQTHLLHGLIHCNGFGHLLCINGIEAGSTYLSGKEIMGLWDRICTNLHARMITVDDTSRKKSMELRLLHGIAHGHPWFGKWGYKFCHGSFGVQAHHYQRAVEILSSLDLDDLVSDLPKENLEVNRVICTYRNLSKTPLVTLRDLFKFMFSLKTQSPAKKKFTVPNPKPRTPVKTKLPLAEAKFQAPLSSVSKLPTKSVLRNRLSSSKVKPTKIRKFESVVATMDTRWPKRRLEYTAEVIVNALKEFRETSKSSTVGMTRQDVRDAARAHIGDTGLLDYVLKSMNNVIVGKSLVRRRTNPVNRVLEYTIQNVGESRAKELEAETTITVEPVSVPSAVPGISGLSDVYGDVHVLYKHLLDQPATSISGLSVRVILDSKHFSKEWPFSDENDQLLRFICCVLPTSCELDMDLSRRVCPGELVVLPLHASFGDLKIAAQHAFRDTYCIMEHYVVEDIESLDCLLDEEAVFGAIESGSNVWIRGRGLDLKTEFRYEGGPDNWTVNCSCGATDDDGERMVSCDICEVWQHTRCSGIEDSDAVPPLFVCNKCCASLMPSKAENISYLEVPQDMMMIPQRFGNPWVALPC